MDNFFLFSFLKHEASSKKERKSYSFPSICFFNSLYRDFEREKDHVYIYTYILVFFATSIVTNTPRSKHWPQNVKNPGRIFRIVYPLEADTGP